MTNFYFQHFFSVILQQPVDLSMFLGVSFTNATNNIYWLLSHITMVETTVNSEIRMNPVEVTNEQGFKLQPLGYKHRIFYDLTE